MYNDIFIKNDTLKLYDKTIHDLKSAVDMEKDYFVDLQEQIKEMKEIVNEEMI